ncbi:acyl-CoA dehydrogenase family protein [Sphingomonas sp. ID0503]|uniref:acyl-CoA dehydrogenase family protein n=1 Tax=Sphingomonas sp. ID0503 TaxID=3399691 RepID=UPI003AFA721A
MDFSFSEEQKSLGETVAQLVADHTRLIDPDPVAAAGGDVWTALAELGLFSLLVPEEHGGVGLSVLDLGLAIEALGAGLAPPLVASTLIATDLIVRHGSPSQQDRYLPSIATGELKIAIATSESDSGYDPAEVRSAVEAGVLSGSKILVAGSGEAGLFLVLAKAEGAARVLLVPANASGVHVRTHEDIDPSASLGELTLDRVSISSDEVLGGNRPAAAVERLIDVAATTYSGLAIGIAARMLATAVEYAKTRIQFGQAIGAFQSIKHRCADMAMMVEAGRSAAYYAFWTIGEVAPDASRASSMAKAYCGEVARDVCNDTIQIHGGMGFTWELGLHRFLRRAKVLEHAFGNHSWHYERVVAQTLALMDDSRGLQAG